MKKWISIAMVCMLVLAFTGCGSPAEAPAAPAPAASAEPAAPAPAPAESAAPAPEEKPIVVAGVVFQDDQFMNSLTQGYKDAAAAAGVQCLTSNTTNDQAKEVELINTYVSQGVAGIAIAPLDPVTSFATLKSADDQGVKISVTNINVKDADFIVGGYTSDDLSNGKVCGEAAVKFIQEQFGDKEINLALVQFKSLLADQSAARVNGFTSALDAAGVKYKIVADQDAWMQDTAVETAANIMTANKDLDIIFAANEGGTVGSTMAVANQNMAGKVFVFGYDGSDQTSSMVLNPDNILQAVVTQDPYNMGYKAMEVLIKAIQGGDYSDTKGVCNIVPGMALSRTDPDAVNKWRADNGL